MYYCFAFYICTLAITLETHRIKPSRMSQFSNKKFNDHIAHHASATNLSPYF